MPWCLVYSTSGWGRKERKKLTKESAEVIFKRLAPKPMLLLVVVVVCVCVSPPLLRYAFNLLLALEASSSLPQTTARAAAGRKNGFVSLSSLSLLSLLSLFSLFISLLSSLSVEVSRDELLYLQVVNACYLRRKIEKKLKEKGRREDHSSRTSLRRRIIIIVIDSTRRLILRGSSYPSIPCERNVGCLNDISDRIDGVIYRITPSIYREGKGSLLSELSKVEVCLLEVLGIIINHD